jgi:hypothetical protein
VVRSRRRCINERAWKEEEEEEDMDVEDEDEMRTR